MLILPRQVGDGIKIGEDMAVTVLGIKGPQVRLEIAAPKVVDVHREEVYERVLAERACEDADKP
jgi:carbon storage regulator